MSILQRLALKSNPESRIQDCLGSPYVSPRCSRPAHSSKPLILYRRFRAFRASATQATIHQWSEYEKSLAFLRFFSHLKVTPRSSMSRWPGYYLMNFARLTSTKFHLTSFVMTQKGRDLAGLDTPYIWLYKWYSEI